MASAVLFVRSLLLLSFFLALNNGGGCARKLAPRVEGGLAHQVIQNPQGNAIKNVTRITSRPILPDLTSIHPTSTVQGNDIQQYAISMESEMTEYYGAKATISVYALPGVQTNQSSSAEIWMVNYGADGSEHANALQAGWHVRPDLYGDTQTHLFVTWTVDNYKATGCFNLQCPGFVVKSGSSVVPGDILSSLSTYSGEQKYITLSINKEPEGDWWLHFGEGTEVTTVVGYWPRSLFSTLADKATYLVWGGVVDYTEDTQGPPMGSSHISSEGANKAACFKNLNFLDQNNDFRIVESGALSVYTSSSDCYDLTEVEDETNGGVEFYFGGPAGCTSG